MRSIAVLNQKGGVGKTTTAVNLSAALADQGERVLLIDIDPQAHASLHLGIAPDDGLDSIYGVLAGERRLRQVRQQVAARLWIAPSHLDLAAAEVELVTQPQRESLLRRALAEEPAADDYVVIDCPPSLGLLTLNALAAVDEVLLPLQPHFLALHGLSKLLRTVEVVQRRINPRLRLTGVVLCMYESGTRLAGEVVRDVEDFFAHARRQGAPWANAAVFKTRIRRNIRLAEAPSYGQSIFQYAPSASGAADYRALAGEVAAMHAAAARAA